MMADAFELTSLYSHPWSGQQISVPCNACQTERAGAQDLLKMPAKCARDATGGPGKYWLPDGMVAEWSMQVDKMICSHASQERHLVFSTLRLSITAHVGTVALFKGGIRIALGGGQP